MQHLSTESGDNSQASCGMTVLITILQKKKHFFSLNDNKEKKHNSFSKIHQNIVLPVQILGGGGAFALPA